ncbi:MAG: SEC-C domain-containing protein [Bryobacterales bacterium]|nr:SEC-C domain-containing protein [Bryobacterales bacterium]
MTPAQRQVVQALAAGSSVTSAAAAAGVTRATIYNWRKSIPAFQSAIDQASLEYADSCRDHIHDLRAKALHGLSQFLDNPSTPPALRLKVIQMILGNSVSPPPTDQTQPSTETAPEPHLVPRGAPCPCGSGVKFKRCCGKSAPPVLNP